MIFCDCCQDEIESEADNFGTRSGTENKLNSGWQDLCKSCYNYNEFLLNK